MAQRGAAGWLQQPPNGSGREGSNPTGGTSGEGSATLSGQGASPDTRRGASNSDGGQHAGHRGAPESRRRRRRVDSTARNKLSGLLARHAVAAGKFACGGTLDPEEWPCLPRIKQRSMISSISLPLVHREAEKLKAAQIKAGQGLDLNEDGMPETRLPWAIRPEIDFKIVNHKIWTTKVVAPVVRKVQEALGCEEWNVEASLSEMLLCEEGCFYSEGKESDESPGVFATLIVQLPSNVEGGVFTVSDPSASPNVMPGGGTEGAVARDGSSIAFSGPSMYYVAFYTDCERELSQVTSGCLLALVYNLRRAELTRKVGEKSGRGAGKEQPWDSGDVSMTKREAQDWEREWAAFCGSAGVCGTSTAMGMAQSTASSKDEQPAWVTDAHRRKRAVFANFDEVPQPAETQRIKEIADAVRHWSVSPHAPPKLVAILSHLYPDCPAGLSELKGRDRAVCNLLRLTREMAARDAYAGRTGNDEAMLDVFLTRIVVSRGGEGKGVFTTGPLVPLEPGDEPAKLRLPAKPGGAQAPIFRGIFCLPPDVLPVDLGSQILHSGGDTALRDLEDDLDEVFFKGPEAVEFLGKRVSQRFRFGDPRTESRMSGGGSAGAPPARFYTRAAVVFWPRAKRESVQMEATSGVHGVVARLRQLLTSLEDMLRSSSSTPGWAQSEDARAMKTSVMTLMRQSQRLIEDDRDVDVMFECLHRCEDTEITRQAIDALCDAFRRPKYLSDPPSALPACACTTASGGVPIKMDIDALKEEPQERAPSSPTVSTLSATGLFSRVFSLCDGLRCWRAMSPQFRRLISLNPSAFAGAVIARVAIWGADNTRGGGATTSSTAKASPRSSLVGSGSTNPWVTVAHMEVRRSSTSGAQTSSSSGTGSGARSTAAPDRGGGSSGSSGSPRVGSPRVGGGLTRDSWQVVIGETLAGAMPDVARGEMRGAERCCSVVDVRSSSCSPSPEAACDAAYSPLPLLTRALQDVVGGLYAARMIRESFGWIVRGEGDLGETEDSTLEERERRLDQLGCLLWNIGDLRRSLPWHDGEGEKSEKTRDAGKEAGAEVAASNGKPSASEGGGGDAGPVSFVRLVVEELQVQLVRVLDAAASISVPESSYPSFQMDDGYACEHGGWRTPDDRDEGLGCVTCEEVVKPFLSNPYACCTSWVPWAGTDGEEFSPAFFQRLGLTFSVEGDDMKAIVLTKPKGSPEIHKAMESVRDAVYLRDRAVDILTSANTLAWLLYEQEEGGRSGGGVGASSGGGGGGGGGGGPNGGPGGGAGGGGAGSPRNPMLTSGGSFTPRGGVSVSGAAGLTCSEIDFVVGNHDDLEYTAIYNEDGAASVCSEDWANLVDSTHERRESMMKDCSGEWESPKATVTTTPNDSSSLKRLLLDGGASAGEGGNTGGGGNATEEAVAPGAGSGQEKEEKKGQQGESGGASLSSQGDGPSNPSHTNARSSGSRRWPDRMDPAGVEKRVWDDRSPGVTSKPSDASRSPGTGTQEEATKLQGVEHASSEQQQQQQQQQQEQQQQERKEQQEQAPIARDLPSDKGKGKEKDVATSKCGESKGDGTTSPAQAAATAVAEAVAVNIEAVGAIDW